MPKLSGAYRLTASAEIDLSEGGELGFDGSIVDLEIEFPGYPHAVYQENPTSGSLRLLKVVYPAAGFPGDLCSVVHAIHLSGEPLAAILLGIVSHPVGSEVRGRLLGAVEIGSDGASQPMLLAVADQDPHFDASHDVTALSPERRAALEFFLGNLRGEAARRTKWLGCQEAREIVREARRRFRVCQNEQRLAGTDEPAWKPYLGAELSEGGSNETQRHSEAEYRYRFLPPRFQKYIEDYLARDERILSAVHRPRMRSALLGGFLRGSRLQEGVFITSNQQMTEVAELVPPDSAGIRYGFVARTGVAERLSDVGVSTLSSGSVGLDVAWAATGGTERHTFEFPSSKRQEVEAAADLLAGWLPCGNDRRLKQAERPMPPEFFRPLKDPAANDPKEVEPLAERLIDSLAQALGPHEIVLARCLLPAWIKGREVASLLVVTQKRLLVAPDPLHPTHSELALDIDVEAISSVEYCSTIVKAYLRLFVPKAPKTEPEVITIDFGKTLAAMDDCFLMLRKCMIASTPLAVEE